MIANVLVIDLLNSFFTLHHNKEADPEWRFINDIKNIMSIWKMHRVILATDTGQSQYRLNKYPQYKEVRRARREAAPDVEKEALSKFFKSVDKFKALAPLLGFEVASIKGVEADDIVSYFSIKTDEGVYRVANMSSDTDMFQLLRPGVMQRSYGPKMKLLDMDIPQQVWVTEDRFKQVYEITPYQYMEAKSLAGDTGDSIYSTVGMGEKTALKLIKKYGSIAEIEKNIDNLDIPRFSAKAREALKENFHIVYRNLELVSLLHTDEKFEEIFGKEGLCMLEDIKARITEPHTVNTDFIKEYLFERGKVNIYNDFDNWVKPLLGR